MDERIAEGRIFTPGDFARCMKLTLKALDGIMKGHEVGKSNDGRRKSGKPVCQRGATNKWFINTLLLVIFSAAGQRLQVYAQVQCPSQNELGDIQAEAERKRYFELRTVCGKTQRSFHMAHLLLRPIVLKYLQFHPRYMRAIVTPHAHIEEHEGSENH